MSQGARHRLSVPGASPGAPTLGARVQRTGRNADAALGAFLDWLAEIGLRLYPAQEDALLALVEDRHVVLGTPTGSGKSLVGLFLHFRALAAGERSVYTSPTKALASEKFFALCDELGPEAVGMLTGDAAVNRDAPVVCCTAEVLANLSVRQGRLGGPRRVVMDEFHYYADADRGVAWQLPLLALPDTQFLLMSATLGDVSDLVQRLEGGTGRGVTVVGGGERPVPLDYAYSETPLVETVGDLLASDKGPVYVVSFSQAECARRAQSIASIAPASRDERRQLARAIDRADLSSPYGTELRRLLRSGVAVHHAGLLPRYRLLVEQLAQQGLLHVVCGTDTLGVGVNIPIRTVLFASLAKYDGRRVRVLSARDFHQIAGRAGRRGFDDRGSVVCQAPDKVIEARRHGSRTKAADRGGTSGRSGQEERAGGAPGRAVAAPAKAGARSKSGRRSRTASGKHAAQRSAEGRGSARRGAGRTIVWNRQTFESLVGRAPERMASRFRVDHGMLLNALARKEAAPGEPRSYAVVVDLVLRSHEAPDRQARHLREAAALFRALRRAGLVTVTPGDREAPPGVLLSADLQDDFSLYATLSLYLVDAVAALDKQSPTYALDVLSVTEAVLEDPQPILQAQQRTRRAELLAQMKSDGVPYEERLALLEEVTHPRPLAEFLETTFAAFARRHPWVRSEDIRPKAIARDLLELGCSFASYVERYGLQRSEGLLLRHLTQVYKAMSHSVPEYDKTDACTAVIQRLRDTISAVDSSLLDEWDRLLGAAARPVADTTAPMEPAAGPS